MEDFRSARSRDAERRRRCSLPTRRPICGTVKGSAIFIDVYPQAPKPPNLPAGTFWRDPAHRSIEGAHWLPNVGYGALSPVDR